MKKIIHFSIFCFITSILFTACKSNLSVTKRRYNSGYYISYNNGKQKPIVAKEETKTGRPVKSDPVTPLKEQEKQKELKTAGNGSYAEDHSTAVASNTKKQYKIVLKQRIKQVQALQAKIIENRTLQIKQALSENKRATAASIESNDDDALSLFWIVILVILILWAIGALSGGFGLGGLINLLLVVALILLILWLLRLV
jgi:hypothetical protein